MKLTESLIKYQEMLRLTNFNKDTQSFVDYCNTPEVKTLFMKFLLQNKGRDGYGKSENLKSLSETHFDNFINQIIEFGEIKPIEPEEEDEEIKTLYQRLNDFFRSGTAKKSKDSFGLSYGDRIDDVRESNFIGTEEGLRDETEENTGTVDNKANTDFVSSEFLKFLHISGCFEGSKDKYNNRIKHLLYPRSILKEGSAEDITDTLTE